MAREKKQKANHVNNIESFIVSVLSVAIAVLTGFFYVDKNYAKVLDMKKENLRIEYEYRSCRLEDIAQQISHLTRLNSEENSDSCHIQARIDRITQLQRIERKMTYQTKELFKKIKDF